MKKVGIFYFFVIVFGGFITAIFLVLFNLFLVFFHLFYVLCLAVSTVLKWCFAKIKYNLEQDSITVMECTCKECKNLAENIPPTNLE